MENEIWKSLDGIVEFGEHYEVSSYGRVRSIDRKVNSRSGLRTVKGQMLKLQTDKDGYKKAMLYCKQKCKIYRVHRLVALAFIPNPNSKSDVNHINGVKYNNSIENLEWATKSENRQHAFDSGLQFGKKGEDSVVSKLTEKEVREIVDLYKTDLYSTEELADKFNISQAQANRIVNRETWVHLDLGEPHKRDLSKTSLYGNEKICNNVIEMHSKGISLRKIAKELGISRGTVTRILNDKNEIG